MTELNTVATVKLVTFHGKLIKCGCSEQEKKHKQWHGNKNKVCPKPKSIKDLGILSYNSNNMLKNIWWKIKQLFKKQQEN